MRLQWFEYETGVVWDKARPGMNLVDWNKAELGIDGT